MNWTLAVNHDLLNVLIFPKQDRDCAQKPAEVMCVRGDVCPWRNTGAGGRLGGVEVPHAVLEGE